jgi:integrase
MAEAKRYKIIKDNPAKEAKRLKEATDEVTPDKIFTKDELRRVIESTEPGSMERIMVMLPAITGCRVGEMLGASWNALDLKAGKFDICSTMADPDKGKPVVFKEPKTQNSRRVVPVPKELIHELKLWKLKCPPSERDLLIASDLGKPIRRRVVARLVQHINKSLGIAKQLTPHSFRHTFASLLLARKVAIPEVSRLLGHKNSAITLRTYAHFTGEETNAVHDLAASIFNVSTGE